MALNNVQSIGAMTSSAALLCGRDLMIFKTSSGVVQSGSVLGMEERALYRSGSRCSEVGGRVLNLSK